MKTLSHQIPILATLSLFLSVLHSTPSVASATIDTTNLIQNSSFESNNQPTLQSWVTDTTLRKFVQDVPPNGGQWSLQLIPGWFPQEGYARTYVSGQSGVGVYQISVWVKSTNGWRSTIRLGQWAQGTWINSKQISSDSTLWIQYSLIDTLSVQPNDTIAVHLSAGRAEIAKGNVLFDLVRLEKIQSITKVKTEHKALPNHFALDQNYPNPFNPTTTIDYELRTSGFVTLSVFDMLGRELKTLVNKRQDAGKYSIDFHGRDLMSGIYFYSLKSGNYSSIKKCVLLK